MSETNNQTVISADTQIRGELLIQHAGLVLGTIEGRVVSQGKLHIGKGAVCKSNVEGSNVIIDGTVEGNVLAREKLELNATAKIKGDITAAKLVVAEGATFAGNCSVGAEAVKNAKLDETPGGIGSGGKPRIKVAGENGLEATLAGLEAKLAGFTKTKAAAD